MESYGVISLHELEGNGVSHFFELTWISVCHLTLYILQDQISEIFADSMEFARPEGQANELKFPLLFGTSIFPV